MHAHSGFSLRYIIWATSYAVQRIIPSNKDQLKTYIYLCQAFQLRVIYDPRVYCRNLKVEEMAIVCKTCGLKCQAIIFQQILSSKLHLVLNYSIKTHNKQDLQFSRWNVYWQGRQMGRAVVWTGKRLIACRCSR